MWKFLERVWGDIALMTMVIIEILTTAGAIIFALVLSFFFTLGDVVKWIVDLPKNYQLGRR